MPVNRWGLHMIRSRLLRVVTSAAGSVVLAAAGVAVAAGPADAGLTLRPRTYSTVLTPATARAGVPTAYAVVVKNTSTAISALDHFVLVIPTGFTLTTGAVTSPRGGWTETVAGGLLSATTSAPIRYGLRPGESMTVRFTATDTTPCHSATVTWVQKADGLIIDPFVAQSPDPKVTVTSVADNFLVTSVKDGSSPPLANAAAVGAPFTVSGTFRCGTTTAPTTGASTVTLVKSSAGTPDTGGVLGGTTSVNVPAGSTTATVNGATYSAVEDQVGVTADWSGGGDSTFRLDVFGDVATVIGTPGVAIPPAQLTVDGAQADLGNGANGPVSLVVSACAPGDQTSTATCSAGTEIELTANYKTDGGVPLYNFDAPARISWLCPATVCPHGGPNQAPEQEPSSNYNYNYECYGNDCASNSSPFGEREVEEDFQNFPLFVSLHDPVTNTDSPFRAAPRCVPLPSYTNGISRYDFLHTTGKIINPDARTLGFCVDVNAITRENNAFGGGLRQPVLFVEDLKLRP
jgi:hypothetical protein